jgi:hypothetical protein
MPGRDILFYVPKSWRTSQPLYQLTDDQALQETEASLAAAAAGGGEFDMCKDPDVVDGSGLDADMFDQGAVKKGGLGVAGRRPEAADDSAHAGRLMFAGKQ